MLLPFNLSGIGVRICRVPKVLIVPLADGGTVNKADARLLSDVMLSTGFDSCNRIRVFPCPNRTVFAPAATLLTDANASLVKLFGLLNRRAFPDDLVDCRINSRGTESSESWVPRAFRSTNVACHSLLVLLMATRICDEGSNIAVPRFVCHISVLMAWTTHSRLGPVSGPLVDESSSDSARRRAERPLPSVPFSTDSRPCFDNGEGDVDLCLTADPGWLAFLEMELKGRNGVVSTGRETEALPPGCREHIHTSNPGDSNDSLLRPTVVSVQQTRSQGSVPLKSKHRSQVSDCGDITRI